MRLWAKYLLVITIMLLVANVVVLNYQMLNVENELIYRTDYLLNYTGYLNSGLVQTGAVVLDNQKQIDVHAQLLGTCMDNLYNVTNTIKNNQVLANNQIQTVANQLDGVREVYGRQIQTVQDEVTKIQTPDSEMLKRVLPSVVQVETVVSIAIYDVNGIFVKNEKLRMGGSGVVVSSGGMILTCKHVFPTPSDMNEIEMYFPGAKVTGISRLVIFSDNKEYKIKHIAVSDKADVALVSIDCDNVLTPVPLSYFDNVNVGDVVWVIGNPCGFSQYITKGIVGKIPSDEYIMLDADVNPGNSGGPKIGRAHV